MGWLPYYKLQALNYRSFSFYNTVTKFNLLALIFMLLFYALNARYGKRLLFEGGCVLLFFSGVSLR